VVAQEKNIQLKYSIISFLTQMRQLNTYHSCISKSDALTQYLEAERKTRNETGSA
jgi:hypothetical protein